MIMVGGGSQQAGYCLRIATSISVFVAGSRLSPPSWSKKSDGGNTDLIHTTCDALKDNIVNHRDYDWRFMRRWYCVIIPNKRNQ